MSPTEPSRDESSTTSPNDPLAASPDDQPGIDALDEHLPAATVDSRWWYWIAAVPAFFVVSTLAGVFAFLIAVFGMVTDLAGFTFLLFFGLFAVFALAGLALSVLFPLAIYIDAKAIATADVEWTPDPVLYGLIAVVAVLMTAFTLSVPLALYYLYQRHRHVGVP